MKAKGDTRPSIDVVVRSVRLEVAGRASGLSPTKRDHVIQVTVEETVALHDDAAP